MKKLVKRLFALSLTLMMLLSFGLVVNAWTPPKLKNPYVEPEEQLRSVWVCTVSNMDIAKQGGTDEAAINSWKEKYMAILNRSIECGMNAIIFQVSPCNDAFYPSKYRPWSEYLAGFGVDAGWDPVEWMIEVTHAAGLEYHAWFNPYRTSTHALTYSITQEDPATTAHFVYDYDQETIYNYKQSYFGSLKDICEANNTLVDNPIFYTGEELDHSVVYGTEGKFVLNPAAESTIENVQNTIREFIENYDADGIHFDDYFYPDDKAYRGSNTEYKKYSFSCEPDIDLNDYYAYLADGGSLSIYDWRRENVNTLIRNLGEIVREINVTDDYKCAFGISPAARWAPSIESCPSSPHRGAEGGMPENCNNYYSYSDLFADTYKWAKEGWIDYILPQVYTYLGDTPSGIPDGNYPVITKWWSNALKDSSCKLFIGTALYEIENWSGAQHATSDEFYYQQMYNQDKGFRVDGYVMFRYDSLNTTVGSKAVTKMLDKVWKLSALTPIYDGYVYDSVDEAATVKELKLNNDGTYTVTYDKISDAKAYGILANGVCVARVLSGKSEIVFAKEDGKTYELVTYGDDNKMHENKDEINFDEVVVNQRPVASFKTDFEEEYLISSKIDVTFNIEDKENDPMKYTLSISVDGRKRDLVANQDVTSNEITYTFNSYAREYENCYFILTVDDSFGPIEILSASFKMVKELTPEPPVHEHEFVEGKCECGEIDPNYVPPHVHEFVEGKCECGETDPNYVPPHVHNFVEGKCECGEIDPNYEPPHEHKFVEGKCECGEIDETYVPPHVHNFKEGKCECGEIDETYVPPHVHNFKDGKCECGETDPNYVAPKKKCGKKGMEIVVAYLSIATILSVVLRKKD